MSDNQADDQTAPVQCAATTRSSDRCRNRAIEGSAYCRMHQGEAQVDAVVDATRAELCCRLRRRC